MAGRPTKLTREVQQTVVEILRNCGTRTAAAGRANIKMVTFLDWLRRGSETSSGIYHDFLFAVCDAEAQAVLTAVRTVRLKMVGGWHKVPQRDRDGSYIFKRDPLTNEILRDAQGRPEADLVDEYTEPDDACARWFLERRAREDFGNAGPSATVNVTPAPARPKPKKKELLNLFSEAVQILVDNGMKLPETAMLEHQGQKAIETTAKLVETPTFNRSGVESMSDTDLDDWVSSHVPSAGQAEKYETIRDAGMTFTKAVCDCTPPSAERRAVIRKIHEAMYNAAIACGGQ
jgi:hypothetical protein